MSFVYYPCHMWYYQILPLQSLQYYTLQHLHMFKEDAVALINYNAFLYFLFVITIHCMDILFNAHFLHMVNWSPSCMQFIIYELRKDSTILIFQILEIQGPQALGVAHLSKLSCLYLISYIPVKGKEKYLKWWVKDDLNSSIWYR